MTIYSVSLDIRHQHDYQFVRQTFYLKLDILFFLFIHRFLFYEVI